MKPDCYVIHYAEVAIKGKNRPLFERILADNISKAVKGLKANGIKRRYGRLILNLKEDSEIEKIEKKLQKTPGISSFSPALKTTHDLNDLKQTALKILQESQAKSFYIKPKRSHKQFPMKSPELARELGKFLGEKTQKTIDFIEPETTIFLEVVENGTYIYTEKQKSLCGLPVGVSGKVLVLLSGGIDSPVAAFLTLKRGCKNIYIHFHSEPYTKESSKEKVIDLAKQIAEFQDQTKIYLVPLAEIQKQVMLKTDKKYRIVLYRRFMFKLAEAIARKNKAKALVTGENLGQVASQTIENINSIHQAINISVLQPLITYDKQEIIDLAIKIGTYETSILPHDDCCSLFVPKHPIIKSQLKDVEEQEAKLDVETLIKETLGKTEVVQINPSQN
jgi:tRNA uracil 4-sulfurtransferase